MAKRANFEGAPPKAAPRFHPKKGVSVQFHYLHQGVRVGTCDAKVTQVHKADRGPAIDEELLDLVCPKLGTMIDHPVQRVPRQTAPTHAPSWSPPTGSQDDDEDLGGDDEPGN